MTPNSRFPFAIVGFDLDGTLLDTGADLAAALNHALAAGGHQPIPVAEAMRLVGGGARHLLVRAVGHGDDAEVDRLLPVLLDYYEANIDVHTRPFPGAIEAVDELRAKGVKCALVTNKRESFTHKLIGRLGLTDRFACMIGGDTLGAGKAKPAPDMILAMIEQCGGGAVAFVGDSIYDVGAARAAGIPVIACSFGYSDRPVKTLGADAVIDRFDDLIPTLECLGAP